MLTFLLVLVIIACVLLVLIILAQNPKGGGLSPSFGGGASPVMGARKTAEGLEKLTWYIGIGIITVVLFTNLFLPKETADVGGSLIDSDRVRSSAPAAPGQQSPQMAPGTQPQQQLPLEQPEQVPQQPEDE
jgi:preprotein translocase subunit SecG